MYLRKINIKKGKIVESVSIKVQSIRPLRLQYPMAFPLFLSSISILLCSFHFSFDLVLTYCNDYHFILIGPLHYLLCTSTNLYLTILLVPYSLVFQWKKYYSFAVELSVLGGPYLLYLDSFSYS